MAIRSSLHIDDALMLLEEGDFSGAELALNRAILIARQQSDNLSLVRALVTLGDCLAELDREDEAQDYMSQALSVDLGGVSVTVYSELQRAREMLGI